MSLHFITTKDICTIKITAVFGKVQIHLLNMSFSLKFEILEVNRQVRFFKLFNYFLNNATLNFVINGPLILIVLGCTKSIIDSHFSELLLSQFLYFEMLCYLTTGNQNLST